MINSDWWMALKQILLSSTIGLAQMHDAHCHSLHNRSCALNSEMCISAL